MNHSEEGPVALAARMRPRWRWATLGVTLGALLIVVAMFLDPFNQVMLGLVGMTVLLATVVTWLLVGPAEKPSRQPQVEENEPQHHI